MKEVKGVPGEASKITWKGVKVKGPLGSKEVELWGDKIEKTPTDSFIQGMAKGLGISLLGGAYPILTTAYKSLEGYDKVQKVAKEVGLDEWAAARAGIKGAVVGGFKGFTHGIVDTLVIGALIGFGAVIGGPVGGALAALIGGGMYNVAKDAWRND